MGRKKKLRLIQITLLVFGLLIIFFTYIKKEKNFSGDIISKETKKLVWNVANEMGYQPNIFARRLALGKSETIAYLLPFDKSETSNPFVNELIAGMSSELSKNGWDLNILSPSSEEEEIEKFKINSLNMMQNLNIAQFKMNFQIYK